MKKVKLGTVLKEEKAKIGLPDGGGLDLIGVSNEYGLHVSRAQRIPNLSKYKIIKIGWFAYNPMRVNVGSIGIAQDANHEGIVSPDYVVFSCSDKILPEYLLFFLKSDIGLEAINKNASGAVRKRLYYSDLARIDLNVPSIEKQIEILASMKKIESIVTQLRDPKRKEKVFQLKQSILQEAIQGKLTAEWRDEQKALGMQPEPASGLLNRIQTEKAKLIKEKKIKKEKPLPPITEKEKPFELPEGWKWSRLGEFADVKRGISPRYSENGISKMINQKCVRWFDLEIIHSKSIDKEWFESLHENRKTDFLDLLVNSTGEGTIGRSAIVSQSIKGYGFDSHILRVRPYLDFISFYLAISVNSIYGQGLIDDLKGAKSTKQTELGSSNLSSFSIPVPPLEEQKAIVSKVESLMAKCHELEEEISQSELYAKMLMQSVLKEAFENRTDEAAEDTSHLTAKLSILPSRRGFAKLVLAGKIIIECKDNKELTNIKFQKLQHLAEHLMEADLNLNYYNQAAGPYDPKFMHTVHRKLKDQKWFASSGSIFSHLEKSTEIDGYFNTFFGVKAAQFSKLCKLLGKATEAQCEIISTLYAVWNDRIIKGESIASELLIKDFYNWSDRKHSYSTKQLQEAIQWMKEKGLEPTGFGYLIKHKKQK